MYNKGQTRRGQDYYAVGEEKQVKTIPAGVYKAQESMGGIYFETLPIVSDEIMDLESSEYQETLAHMDWFLKEETESNYKKHGFLYKTGMLLYGEPGTGKTSLISRVSKRIVESGGVVIYCEKSEMVKAALEAAPSDKLATIILEEVDTMHDGNLLSVLDGEVQRDKVIFLATTNYRERITPRLLRPSRLGKKIEVSFPNDKARLQYFTVKLKGNEILAQNLTSQTEGLSVDDLKHVIIMTQIQDMTIQDAVKAIRKEKTK